jgi:uncharacterized protein YwgA
MTAIADQKHTIGRRDLLLLLLGPETHTLSGDEGLGGITRLQKLLFLLEEEERVTPKGEDFAFEPYKAGPYSPKLYDDLEFLENLGLIKKRVTAEGTEAEAAEMDFTFENLIEPEREQDEPFGPAPDAYEEYSYTLTDEGLQKVQHLLTSKDYRSVAESVSRIKARFKRYSLQDLLYYVYTKYPDMTTESEIKEKVLRRHRR